MTLILPCFGRAAQFNHTEIRLRPKSNLFHGNCNVTSSLGRASAAGGNAINLKNDKHLKQVRVYGASFHFYWSVWCSDPQSAEAFQGHPLGSLRFHQLLPSRVSVPKLDGRYTFLRLRGIRTHDRRYVSLRNHDGS
jgi:hypothetical protein